MKSKNFFIVAVLITSGCLRRDMYIDYPILPPSHFSHQENVDIPEGTTLVYRSDWWTFWDDPRLSDLINKALDGNPDYRQLLSRIKESRDLMGIRSSQSWPNIGASAQVGRQKILFPKDIEYFGVQQGFGIKWEMDLFGVKKSQELSAYEKYLSLNSSKHASKLLLSTEVAKTYIHIMSLLYREKIISEMIEWQNKALSFSEKLWAIGFLDLENRNTIASAYKNLEIKKSEIRKAIELYTMKLAILLGKLPEKFEFNHEGEFYIDSIIRKAPIPTAPLPIDVLNRRWDVAVQYHILKSAMHDVGAAQASLYPQLMFAYDINEQRINISGNSLSGPIYNLGFSLSIPFFSETLRRQVSAKKDAVERHKEKYRDTIIKALADVERAYIELHASMLAAQKQESISSMAQESYNKLEKEHYLGNIDYLTLAKQKINELKEKASLQERKEEQLENIISLYKSMGGHWTRQKTENKDSNNPNDPAPSKKGLNHPNPEPFLIQSKLPEKEQPSKWHVYIPSELRCSSTKQHTDQKSQPAPEV